jgi:hypothetical protein
MLQILRRRRARAAVKLAASATVVRPSADVLTAERDGVAVLLDLRREVYLGLDEVGATIWRGIEDGATAAEIADRIADEYDVAADAVLQDVTRFMDDLVHRRLVVVAR